MGYATLQPPQKTRRAKLLCSEKSASGDFFAKAVTSSLGNPSQPLKTQQENYHTSTKTASGVRIKNYLDHVYAVSDDNGNLIEHYRYTAFGEPEIYSATGAKRNDSAIGNTVMWNTRRYDANNGLYYYKYRHYAANIGRWLGRDPLGDEAFLLAYDEKCNEGEQCSIKRDRKLAELTAEGQKNLYMFVGNNVLNIYDDYGLAVPAVAAPIIGLSALQYAAAVTGATICTCLFIEECRGEAYCRGRWLACQDWLRGENDRTCFDCFHSCRNDGFVWPADC